MQKAIEEICTMLLFWRKNENKSGHKIEFDKIEGNLTFDLVKTEQTKIVPVANF
jgi:hypothetical protein